MNKNIVQYIIAKDAFKFRRGSYIKNLTPSVLTNASAALDDIQELFSGVSNKSFEDVFGDTKENVIKEIEELYARGSETSYGLKGSRVKVDSLRKDSAAQVEIRNKIKEKTNDKFKDLEDFIPEEVSEERTQGDYPIFITDDSLSFNIYAGLSKVENKELKKDFVKSNVKTILYSGLDINKTSLNDRPYLAFPKFIRLTKDKQVNIWKVKSFNVTLGGKSIEVDYDAIVTGKRIGVKIIKQFF